MQVDVFDQGPISRKEVNLLLGKVGWNVAMSSHYLQQRPGQPELRKGYDKGGICSANALQIGVLQCQVRDLTVRESQHMESVTYCTKFGKINCPRGQCHHKKGDDHFPSRLLRSFNDIIGRKEKISLGNLNTKSTSGGYRLGTVGSWSTSATLPGRLAVPEAGFSFLNRNVTEL
ncbi:hypothetical protein J6590_013089 [Homalodisca vitripennis]|nr:hypothetical protein J6590_013089 [Homalodisca vitripennis]